MMVNKSEHSAVAPSSPNAWRTLMLMAFVMGSIWIYLSRAPLDTLAQESTLEAAMTGFLAPDFTLTTLGGSTVQLSALRGKPVIVNFWATWCPPCRAEMPELEEVWQKYDRGNLMLLGVNQGEDAGAVNRFKQQIVDFSFPILLDTRQAVGSLYGVRAMPTTFFIDAAGRIQDIKVGGPMDTAMLLDGVNKIVE